MSGRRASARKREAQGKRRRFQWTAEDFDRAGHCICGVRRLPSDGPCTRCAAIRRAWRGSSAFFRARIASGGKKPRRFRILEYLRDQAGKAAEARELREISKAAEAKKTLAAATKPELEKSNLVGRIRKMFRRQQKRSVA